MKALAIIATILLGMLVTACATGYQGKGFTGGFNDTQLAPDVFRVSFSGNAFTSNDRVQDFALLRAAEITLANNFKYFAVINSTNQSKTETYVSPGSARTTGTVSGYGGTAYYSGTTTYDPPQVNTYYKPGVGLMVRAFASKPDDIFTFDAEFIFKSIRSKYGIQ